ncbi:MAG: hypothetical protein M1368_01905 [Thaumarchaeota archaeon]|nr:hypothetical protein [Nitrososphaerota archaeon]MDG6908548.1 hypothetical protein [Nitrososphaerota archaeon]
MDSELIDAFEKSLSEVIGPSPARAFIVNERVSREHFDPQEIDSALTRVFGISNAGVNLVRKQVLNRFSSSLNLDGKEEPSPQLKAISSESDFVSAVQQIANKYRVLRAPPKVTFSGAVAALISSICCLSPLVLALLGLASFSAAASLAMSLTSTFKPLEIAAGFVTMGGVVYFQLRKEKQCNLSGLRRNLGYILVPLALMLVVYAVINYLFYVYWFRMFNLGDLFP